MEAGEVARQLRAAPEPRDRSLETKSRLGTRLVLRLAPVHHGRKEAARLEAAHQLELEEPGHLGPELAVAPGLCRGGGHRERLDDDDLVTGGLRAPGRRRGPR